MSEIITFFDSKHKGKREADKRQKRLIRQISTAINDFNLISAHDKVLVCVSGGKDSLSMLELLLILQKRAVIPFEIIAMNLDQGHPEFPASTLPRYFESLNVNYKIIKQDTYSVVQRLIPEGKTKCSLCSRMRRGAIYKLAKELGVTKVALGHHRDDVLATFFLNMFYASKLKTMPPKLISDDQKHILIRPLVYCAEADLAEYANENKLPIIPCNLCGSQPNLQRQQIAKMLREWKKKHPCRVDNIFRSLSEINAPFLYDAKLFDFKTLDIPTPLQK